VVQFNLQVTSESGNTWTVIIPLVLHAPEIEVSAFEFIELNGNGNGRADAGEQIRIRMPNENVGSAASIAGSALMTVGAPTFQVLAEELNPTAIEAGYTGYTNFDYQIPADFAVPAAVSFAYSAAFGAYDAAFSFTLPVGERVEDFENGLPAVNWSSPGDFPWVEDQSVVFEGSTSMKSGSINNLEQSDLFLSGNVTEPAEIKFNYKVSSEEGYDFLRFYVDGVEMASWSGLVDWTEVSFPVSAGQHEFQWSYSKDDIVAANDDAAWIDFVHLPNMDGSQGIESHSSNAVLRIYPNPVNNFVTLSGCKEGEYRIDLINQLGQIVATYSGKALENRLTIILDTQLPAGVYFLKIAQSTNETQTLRLLKF
jgi:hypothetical protein